MITLVSPIEISARMMYDMLRMKNKVLFLDNRSWYIIIEDCKFESTSKGSWWRKKKVRNYITDIQIKVWIKEKKEWFVLNEIGSYLILTYITMYYEEPLKMREMYIINRKAPIDINKGCL
jgi:hypothetical protein